MRAPFPPRCGCDGKTYGNDCARQAAGVSKRSDGKCGSAWRYSEFLINRPGAGFAGRDRPVRNFHGRHSAARSRSRVRRNCVFLTRPEPFNQALARGALTAQASARSEPKRQSPPLRKACADASMAPRGRLHDAAPS